MQKYYNFSKALVENCPYYVFLLTVSTVFTIIFTGAVTAYFSEVSAFCSIETTPFCFFFAIITWKYSSSALDILSSLKGIQCVCDLWRIYSWHYLPSYTSISQKLNHQPLWTWFSSQITYLYETIYDIIWGESRYCIFHQ